MFKSLVRDNSGLIIAFSILGVASCGTNDVYRETRTVMGTVVEVSIGGESKSRADDAFSRVFETFDEVDRLVGRGESSFVTQLNKSRPMSQLIVEKGLCRLFAMAGEVSEASGGAFDVTIGPVSRLWDFDDGGKKPQSQDLVDSVHKVGYQYLDIDKVKCIVGFAKPEMAVDIGAIAKGWAVDLAIERMRAMRIRSAIVDAGGDLRLLGSRPGKGYWRIGVQHPRSPGELLASFDLTDTAIVTSGDYERFFIEDGVRYHHILDPKSGMPARGCQSVTVIAPTAMEADACATAAFVLGPEKGIAFLRKRPGVRGLLVDADGRLHWTDRALEASAHL